MAFDTKHNWKTDYVIRQGDAAEILADDFPAHLPILARWMKPRVGWVSFRAGPDGRIFEDGDSPLDLLIMESKPTWELV